jgi:hypothetical protein
VCRFVSGAAKPRLVRLIAMVMMIVSVFIVAAVFQLKMKCDAPSLGFDERDAGGKMVL